MKNPFLFLFLLITLTACSSLSQEKRNMTQDPMNNAVIEAIMARRSIRAYKPQTVEREKMDLIAKCGIHAPNGMNAQNWEVRLVDDPAFIADATAAYVSLMKDNPRGSKMVSDPGFKNMFRNAPSLIFIATRDDAVFGKVDCGLMAENMMLAAQSMGIGSICLAGPVSFFFTPAGAPFLQKLNFSEGYKPLLILGFGYADEAPDARPRDERKISWVE